eukprot:2601726-Amphidinium_carterae.1
MRDRTDRLGARSLVREVAAMASQSSMVSFVAAVLNYTKQCPKQHTCGMIDLMWKTTGLCYPSNSARQFRSNCDHMSLSKLKWLFNKVAPGSSGKLQKFYETRCVSIP